MIGKLLVHAATRWQEAIDRMDRSYAVHRADQTTIGLHRRLMANGPFREGGVDIHFLERLLKA